MSQTKNRLKWRAPKSVLFYLLGFYVLAQFAWWAYMLVDLNAEIYELRLELLQVSGLAGPEQMIMKGDLDQKLSLRIWMVLGEGAVFVTILIIGFLAVKRSIEKELKLAEQQKNFLLSVTHELRSPLASVKLQLQTLRSRKLDEDKTAMLQGRALKDVNRLEKLVENLLLVNKVESGRLPLQTSKVNLSDLVEKVLGDHYGQDAEEGRVVFERSEGLFSSVDQMAMDSIIINLLDNALKYGEGTNIHVKVAQSSDKSIGLLSVADKGSGIPDSEKEKIFDRFYRIGNEEVRKTKGTGIGLYLVKLLVEAQRGTISVTDNNPTGSVFTVTIPVEKG